MAIITFAQVKGGSGKTTAAMCTVAELVARHSTVAALDLDPNRPLGEFFQRVPDLKDTSKWRYRQPNGVSPHSCATWRKNTTMSSSTLWVLPPTIPKSQWRWQTLWSFHLR